jgi:FtsP/CotA-like multicopper oxidase with cupredoxin domain
MKMKKVISISKLLPVVMTALALLFTATAHAAAPGITGTTFNLTAQAAYLNQPDGAQVYSWGYGCTTGTGLVFAPAAVVGATCPTMQVPGPTLIVTEGSTVMVTLTNNLPLAAGNTSILFPGFTVTTTTGAVGLLTHEATPGGGTVTYQFVASAPGTHAYYSGTQSDLQIEMGLYGAIIVLPSSVPANCNTGLAAQNLAAQTHWGESDIRLAHAAYDHAETCYDREYLFQFAEMDLNIHRQALAQVNDPKRVAACATLATAPGCSLEVPTEPYSPAYFLINGRSMPDDMDANYAVEYPHQPYNGNPHMHPGEQVLIRVIGQGRWQHPFHEHGNHVRILGRDGNLILSASNTAAAPALAGPLLFTTTTTPGQAFDGIFYWTGRGLNWDPYGHNPASTDPLAKLTCTPDANGYNTGAPTARNYYEWCQDHNKPLQVAPFGDVAAGGPVTLPDPNILTNGAWYGGSPYLGPDATLRAVAPACAITTNANCSSQQPSNTQANPPNERGYAFMWHSHNEREITTNNVFPGGMLMMMLVDSREFVIDESN